jgi:hypothetical protein
MFLDMEATNTAIKHLELAEVTSYEVSGLEGALFLEEVGDQKPSDRAETVIFHHLWRAGG